MNARSKTYGPPTSRRGDYCFAVPKPAATTAPEGVGNRQLGPATPAPTTASAAKPRSQPKPVSRSAKLVLTITVAGKAAEYSVRKLKTSGDPVFTLSKADGVTYVLRSDTTHGNRCSCEAGAHGKTCKHVLALQAIGLINAAAGTDE